MMNNKKMMSQQQNLKIFMNYNRMIKMNKKIYFNNKKINLKIMIKIIK